MYMGISKPWDFTLTSRRFTRSTTKIPPIHFCPFKYFAQCITYYHRNWVKTTLKIDPDEVLDNLSHVIVGHNDDYSVVKYLEHCYSGFSIGKYDNSYYSDASGTTPSTNTFDLTKIHTKVTYNRLHDPRGRQVKISISYPVLYLPEHISLDMLTHNWSKLNDPANPAKYLPGLPNPHAINIFMSTYVVE